MIPEEVRQKMNPFALLADIDRRSRANALGIPQQVEVRRTWSGIGFRLGDVHLLSTMGEVREVLEYPQMTRVPGAQEWVLGIANVRGNLLTIIDLNAFFFGKLTTIRNKTRVLELRHGGLATGLVVDEVFGMRHFFDEDKTADKPATDQGLMALMTGGYRQGDRTWGELSMYKLAEDPRFLHAASQH